MDFYFMDLDYPCKTEVWNWLSDNIIPAHNPLLHINQVLHKSANAKKKNLSKPECQDYKSARDIWLNIHSPYIYMKNQRNVSQHSKEICIKLLYDTHSIFTQGHNVFGAMNAHGIYEKSL